MASFTDMDRVDGINSEPVSDVFVDGVVGAALGLLFRRSFTSFSWSSSFRHFIEIYLDIFNRRT